MIRTDRQVFFVCQVWQMTCNLHECRKIVPRLLLLFLHLQVFNRENYTEDNSLILWDSYQLLNFCKIELLFYYLWNIRYRFLFATTNISKYLHPSVCLSISARNHLLVPFTLWHSINLTYLPNFLRSIKFQKFINVAKSNKMHIDFYWKILGPGKCPVVNSQ